MRKMANSTVIAEKVLEKAITIIMGDRQDDYGSAEDSFAAIASLFNAGGVRMSDEKQPGNMRMVEPADAASMMIMLKLAREGNRSKLDNMVDICGYAALRSGVMLSERLDKYAEGVALGLGEAKLLEIAGSYDVYMLFREIEYEASIPNDDASITDDGEPDALG